MLTVTLSTHNGAETLPTTLEAFTRLDEPEGGWKLIVVDNARTAAITEAQEMPRAASPFRLEERESYRHHVLSNYELAGIAPNNLKKCMKTTRKPGNMK